MSTSVDVLLRFASTDLKKNIFVGIVYFYLFLTD
jgi:hypothetical protein